MKPIKTVIDGLFQSRPPQDDEYIKRLSRYMHFTHKHYDDHAATIRRWYSKDNPTPPARKYERKESESL